MKPYVSHIIRWLEVSRRGVTSLKIHRETAAVVLGMDANGLGVARNLGRVGVQVIGVSFNPGAPGLMSRYCTPLLTADPSVDPQEALATLLDLGKRLSTKGILYPTSDAFVLFISRFREQLSQHFLFAIPSQDLVETVVNKRRFYELAKRTGTPYPLTLFPETIGDVNVMKNEIEYPAFIKPYYSHVWSDTFRKKGFVVNNPEQLVQKYEKVFDAKLHAMVQEIIEGPSANIVDVHAYISTKNVSLGTFVNQHVRKYPANFGVGTCVESVHDELALEVGMKFFQKIKYVGIGEIELKRDRHGSYKMLELNARTCLQSIHPTFAGVNLALIQYRDLTNQTVPEDRGYKDSVKWLDAFQDLRSSYALSRMGQLSLRHWLMSIRKVDCHAYFARDDLKPFMRQYLNRLSEIPQYFAARSQSQ